MENKKLMKATLKISIYSPILMIKYCIAEEHTQLQYQEKELRVLLFLFFSKQVSYKKMRVEKTAYMG